jgi:hypothetical protein
MDSVAQGHKIDVAAIWKDAHIHITVRSVYTLYCAAAVSPKKILDEYYAREYTHRINAGGYIIDKETTKKQIESGQVTRYIGSSPPDLQLA